MKLEKQLDDRLFKGSAVPEGTNMKKLLEKKEERISSLEARLEKMELGGPGTGTQARGDKLLEEIISKVQKLYVDKDKTTRERLVRAAVKGMVRSLDDHSVFMEAEDSKSFQEDIKGRYAGIGTQITKAPGGPLEVLRPIYGGPAYKAGILSGDLIIEVEDAEGPYGAKGLGEHVLIPTAPAILNALRDATGVIVADLPATPDKVMAALMAYNEE